MEEKLKELMGDTSFCEELEKTSSPEEASALFAQHGIQITPEELLAAVAQPEGELDEKDLDAVSGGSWFPVLRILWRRKNSKSNGGFSGGGSGGGGVSSW